MSESHVPITRVEAEARNWLVRLSGGDAEAQAAFEDWFVTDPAHADAYEALLQTWEQSGQVGRSLLARSSRGDQRGSRWGRRYLAAAAIAALLVVGLFGVGMLGKTGVRDRDGPPVLVATGLGELRKVKLADGTVAMLDTDSRIELKYSLTKRWVRLLRGRVRLAVAAAAQTPFVLTAAGGSVSTNGGLFDASVGKAGFTVAALRNPLDFKNGKGDAPPRRVDQGYVFAVVARTPFGTARPVRRSDLRWTTGMLSFENAKLSDVLAQANRYAGTEISVGDQRVAALRFTGTFRPQNTVALVHVLAATFDLDVVRDGNGGYILRSRPRP